MHRSIVFLLVVIMAIGLFETAFADEVLFRELPWGSNVKEYEKTYNVNDGMIISRENETLMKVSTRIESIHPKMIQPDDNNHAGWVSVLFNLDTENGLKVSGYPISMAYAYFTYGIDKDGHLLLSSSECELYMAEYVFETQNGQTIYDELKSDLDSRYGEGEEKLFYSRTINKNDKNEWEYIDAEIYKCYYYGDNHTICMIEKAMNGDKCFSLSLVFANEQGDDIIDRVISIMN